MNMNLRHNKAVLVSEALEQVARSERDPEVRKALIVVARYADTEALLYLGRLLK
jgi:hypothetical protein